MNSEQIVFVASTPRAMDFFAAVMTNPRGIVRLRDNEFVMPDVATASILLDVINQDEFDLADDVKVYKDGTQSHTFNVVASSGEFVASGSCVKFDLSAALLVATTMVTTTGKSFRIVEHTEVAKTAPKLQFVDPTEWMKSREIQERESMQEAMSESEDWMM